MTVPYAEPHVCAVVDCDRPGQEVLVTSDVTTVYSIICDHHWAMIENPKVSEGGETSGSDQARPR